MTIGFELNGPNDMTTSSMLTYTNGDGKTLWMVSIMPEDKLNLREEYMEFGTLSILANKPEPGTYTFTLVWMEVTEMGSNEMGEISVNVNIEGDATPESTTEEDTEGGFLEKTGDGILESLPGPSFVSIVSLLGLIVYRRKK
jgi:hypothetical protein